jgi:DNA-binding NtrC family response regulator
MQSKAILIVDDDAILLRWLTKDLEQEEFLVTKASSGEEAIALLKENKFNLVVTDLVMPGLGGIHVLKEAKKKDPYIGVVILTGHGDLPSAIDALRLGADDYLLKPYDIDELILRIGQCLMKQEAFQKVNFFENILPVCMYCKSIRDDTGKEPGNGKWIVMEEYLNIINNTSVSHTCCPQCRHRAEKDMLGD